MIWFVIGVVLIALAVAQKVWPSYALGKLKLTGRSESLLVEPGETLAYTCEITNTSCLPISFVRLLVRFPVDSTPKGDPGWVKAHCRQSVATWYFEDRFSLRPRSRIKKQVMLSFDRRGVYHVGEHRLSAGDILGFREESREGDGESVVVIPLRSGNQTALDAFGGFLGDISVRRFILEDPVLTIGFRDYTGREPLKSVSWTRTAMTGSLQVKQFDHTAEQNVMVLLNVEGGSAECLEECFRLTRSVCETLERKKIPFGLRTNGNLPGPVGKIFHLQDGLGGNHLNTLLYGLGKADYTCYFGLHTLVKQALKARKNNESYILITPPLDDGQRLAQRHLSETSGSSVCVLTAGEEP